MTNYEIEQNEYAELVGTPEGQAVLGNIWKPLPAAPVAPPLNTALLPSVLSDMAQAVAGNQSAPFDLPAIVGLGVGSACACGRVAVRLRDGWDEPAQLYLLCAMPSGSGKTPAFHAMGRLLFEEQAEENRSRIPQIKKAETAVRVLEDKKQKAIKKNDTAEAQRLDDEILAHPPAHLIRRFISGNVTPERLLQIMQENEGATTILDDEGGMFDLLSGRYQDCPDVDPWLKAYSSMVLTSERKGGSVIVDKPALSMTILTQPFVLQEAMQNERFLGKGLMQRFLIAQPPPVREYEHEPDIPAGVAEAYQRRVRQLWGLPRATLRLTPEAQSVFFAWRDELRGRLGESWSFRYMDDFISKLAGTTARLACQVKLWENPDTAEPITAVHLRAGIGLAEYFYSHLLQAVGVNCSLTGLAREALQFMLKQGQATLRENDDIKRKLRDRKLFRAEGAIDAALGELERAGYLRRTKSPGQGRPVLLVELNPDLLPKMEVEEI